jgi:7-cyano-7-deazaguanine tRNA-ribosyltransferase
VRQAIAEESIWELVETRCRAHPAMLEALHRLPAHSALLDAHEPLSRRGAVYYTGPETLKRPAVREFRRRVATRFRPRGRRILAASDEVAHPYRESLRQVSVDHPDASIFVRSPLGPVPFELEGVYPACQSVFPAGVGPDPEASALSRGFVETHRGAFAQVVESLDALAGTLPGRPIDRDLATVAAICDHQLGPDCTDLVLKEPLRFVRSRTTGRVKNVFSAEEHVLSIRAYDGLCSLKLPGAARILGTGRHQVVAKDDAAPFVRQGKNVFSRFVVRADPALRPADEAIVVTGSGELLGVGRSEMTAAEMATFRRGVAVRIRDSVGGGPAHEGIG